MKISVTSLSKANRFNDWFVYQKSGCGVGSLSRKALLRPIFEVQPKSVPVESVSRSSLWKRFIFWFKSLFKSLKLCKSRI